MSEEQKKMSAVNMLREELKRKGHPDYRDKDEVDKPKVEGIPIIEDSTMDNYHTGVHIKGKSLREIQAEFDKNPQKPLFRDRSFRLSLGERSFRRYEVFIAIASHGSFYIDSATERCGRHNKTLTQHTLALAMRDAILGYHRYCYKSVIIPSSLAVESLKIREDPDSSFVEVHNDRLNRVLTHEDVATLKRYYQEILQKHWNESNGVDPFFDP